MQCGKNEQPQRIGVGLDPLSYVVDGTMPS